MVRARVAGLLVFLLGLWGGIVAFVGPLIHLGVGLPAWTWTRGFGELQVTAAAACVVGGLLLMSGGSLARLGGWLGVVGGAWFVLGPVFAPLWNLSAPAAVPRPGWAAVERVLAYHTGTGLVALLVSAAVLGTVARMGRRARGAPVSMPPATMERRTPAAM